MPKLLEILRSLGTRRLIAAAAATLVTAVTVISLAYFATRPDMTLVYSGLEPSEAGKIVATLEQMGMPVEPSNGGTAVSVPRDMIDRARMALAEQGLPNTPGVGYELFDKADGFGLTTFMQRVNRLRAMEGELARTVSTLAGVEGARVHLVLPERESFSRTAPEPTASVVVRMKGGRTLELSQARAIRHLVASAVPGLKASAVTIADSEGQTVLSEGDDSSASGTDARTTLESKLQRNLEDILTARLGAENVRVGVTVEIETARETIRRQQYDPDGRVIRSTQTVEDKQRSTEGSSETPTTVQQNLPNADLLNGPAGGSSGTSSDRTEETVNYEISNEVTEKVLEPGDVRRLSVAVIVNGSWTEAEDGTRTYAARTPEEIASLEELVKTAVGFQQDRGDMVSVQSLQFAETGNEGTDEKLSVAELLARNSGQIAMWLLIAVVATLGILFVVRPLVRFLTEQRPEPEASADAPAATENGEEPAVQVNISEEQPQSASREMLVLGLQEAVDENPDEAVKVVRAWIQEGTL